MKEATPPRRNPEEAATILNNKLAGLKSKRELGIRAVNEKLQQVHPRSAGEVISQTILPTVNAVGEQQADMDWIEAIDQLPPDEKAIMVHVLEVKERITTERLAKRQKEYEIVPEIEQEPERHTPAEGSTDAVLEMLTAPGTPKQELQAGFSESVEVAWAAYRSLHYLHETLESDAYTEEQRGPIYDALQLTQLEAEENTDQLWIRALHERLRMDSAFTGNAWDIKRDSRSKFNSSWNPIDEDGAPED